MYNMKSATLRQLRHQFGTVLSSIEEGETVQISKRGKIIALVCPPPAVKPPRPRKRPDFQARLRRIYGRKLLPGNSVLEARHSRIW